MIHSLVMRTKLTQPSVSAHTLRHTFATNYLRANPNQLVELAQLLGHDSLNTTAIYTKPVKLNWLKRLRKARLIFMEVIEEKEEKNTISIDELPSYTEMLALDWTLSSNHIRFILNAVKGENQILYFAAQLKSLENTGNFINVDDENKNILSDKIINYLSKQLGLTATYINSDQHQFRNPIPSKNKRLFELSRVCRERKKNYWKNTF